jgi:hypothetical protein
MHKAAITIKLGLQGIPFFKNTLCALLILPNALIVCLTV